ncbi:MAG: sialidase family protein, partial [Myxococcota bacterium]
GCGGDPVPAVRWETSDIRIDGGDAAEVDPDSLGARFCSDGADARYAVWTDDRSGVESVWFSASTDGGATWSEAVNPTGSDAAARVPAIGCDAASVQLVWEDTRTGVLGLSNVFQTASTDGGATFSLPTNVSRDINGHFDARNPTVAVAGDEVYVAYMQDLYGSFDVFVAASADRGATFAIPQRVEPGTAGETWSGWPQLAAAGGGLVYAVWEDMRNGAIDVLFAASTDGGATWVDQSRVDLGDEPGATDSGRPRIAAADGQVWVVWHDARVGGENFGIFANYRVDGGAWLEPALRVDGADAAVFAAVEPELVVSNGAAHVVWSDDRWGSFDVYTRVIGAGTLTGDEIALDHSGTGFTAINPRIAARDGRIAVVWEDNRWDLEGGHDDLYYTVSEDDGASWLDHDLQLNSYAQGAAWAIDAWPWITADGDLQTGWTDGRLGTADVYTSTLALGEAASIPDNTTVGGEP